MDGRINYEFHTKMWKHASPGGWYFVSLPKVLSKEIRENLQWQEEGWGRMKAFAEIGEVNWKTAIWYDTKMETYLLPIKAEIRTKSDLELNKEFKMGIWI
ncbi:MAG: DUF1905 domain-containing protein [Balneolales bacterium]|nr:DUF1905 domain-containing protein [Balneolales bacterium]